MKRIQWLTAPMGKEAQNLSRWLLTSMMLLIITTSALLAYGLAKTAEITASQIGQLEVDLLAEGEAERLDLLYQEGLQAASPQQIEEALARIASERPDIRSLKLLDPNGNLIAAHQSTHRAPPPELSAGWQIGVGSLESGGGQLSRLEITLFKGAETSLSIQQIAWLFASLSALWIVVTIFVVRAFCWTYIELPSQQLQELRKATSEQFSRELSFGFWEEAIQAELDKREKLEKLLASINWRARELSKSIPSRAQAVQAALASIDDLRSAYSKAENESD